MQKNGSQIDDYRLISPFARRDAKNCVYEQLHQQRVPDAY